MSTADVSAPCADGLICDQAHVGFAGQCLPPDVKAYTESCSTKGIPHNSRVVNSSVLLRLVELFIWPAAVLLRTHNSDLPCIVRCAAAGTSCQPGLSCLALEAVSYGLVLPFDNYTACVQTASGDNICECYPGPIPPNGYCFIYGKIPHSNHVHNKL